MRENGIHQVFFRRLHPAGDNIALDQFGDLGPHHMCGQQFTDLGIEYDFDKLSMGSKT